MTPRVLLWRSELLPPSETFIAAQAATLRRYQPVYCGLKAVEPSLDLRHPTVLPRHGARAQRLLALQMGFAPVLLRRARAQQARLVHAHFATDAATALPLLRRMGLPLIVTLHGYDVMRNDGAHMQTRQGRRYLARRRELFDVTTTFLCVSEAIRRTALLRGFPAAKLRVLPMGVDPELHPARAVTPPEPLVLFIGRLVPKKGCATLVLAMRELQRRLPDARLIVAGDGPERAALEALARSHTQGTIFLGRQTSAEIRALLARARCLAAPSCTASDGDGEGLPTVLMEALASGVPVAATLHSGIPELIVHDETGLLSPEHGVEMLTRNLIRLCEDDLLCARLAAAGRRRVEESFHIAEQTRRLEAIYDEVAQAHGAASACSEARLGWSGAPVSAQRGRATVADCVAARAAPEPPAVGTDHPAPGQPPEPRLRRQAAWLLSGNGASMFFQALAFVLIGRMLGAREYGAFVGAVALVNVLAQFSSLGMDIVLLRTISRDRAAFAQAWFRALAVAGFGSLVLMGLVVAYGRLCLPPVIRPLLVSLVLADGLFGRVTQMASRALQAADQARWCAKLLAATNAARCLAASVLLGVCAYRGVAVTLPLWAHAYVASSCLVAVLAVMVVTRLLGRPVRAAISRSHLLEGLSFSLSNSAISVYNDIDKTVLMQCGMFYAAGIYGAAYRVVDVASAPLVSLFGAASPRLFRAGAARGAGGLEPEVRRLLGWAIPGGFGVAAALALGAPVIPRLFGHSFAGSVAVLRWLCLLPLLRGLHYAWGTAITASASQWLRTVAQASVALANLLLNLWLIPLWSWRAAAGVSLLSDGALALVCWAVLRGLAARERAGVAHPAAPPGPGEAAPAGLAAYVS